MKFSILLPTRNRLQYLRCAVETVRRQAYDDWEIIVSDNASDEDIGGYVRSLDDPRVRCYRTEQFVPVTDNWNNALAKSTGDYLIMLGDDDGLLNGYFQRLDTLIQRFEQPDFIYTSAYLFAYPGVIPSAPEGFLQSYGYASFLQGVKEPCLLGRAEALEVVRAAFDFRVVYGFNMQFATVRREFVEALSAGGPFYEPPFPDYYAMNVMFMRAEKIVVCPDPLVAIGVTPKSYGFYHNNNREDAGMEFLNGSRGLEVPPAVADTLLPGTNINTSWLLSLERIKARFPDALPAAVSYRRYRFLQIVHVLKGYYLERTLPAEVLRELKAKLRPRERFLYLPVLTALCVGVSKLSPKWQGRITRRLPGLLRQFPGWGPVTVATGYHDLLEAFEKTAPPPAD